MALGPARSLLVTAARVLGAVCAASPCWDQIGLSPRACVLPCSALLQLFSLGQLLGSLANWARMPTAPTSPQRCGVCGLSSFGPSWLRLGGLGLCWGSVAQCLVYERSGCLCRGRGVGSGSAGRASVC